MKEGVDAGGDEFGDPLRWAYTRRLGLHRRAAAAAAVTVLVVAVSARLKAEKDLQIGQAGPAGVNPDSAKRYMGQAGRSLVVSEGWTEH